MGQGFSEISSKAEAGGDQVQMTLPRGKLFAAMHACKFTLQLSNARRRRRRRLSGDIVTIFPYFSRFIMNFYEFLEEGGEFQPQEGTST